MPPPYRERVRQTPDLLSYWRLGDVAGSTVRDFFFGEDAAVVYTTTAPTFGVTGPLTDESPAPTAMTFDAASFQYLDCGISLRYNLPRVVTVEFWVKKASAPASPMVIAGRAVDANFGWEVYLNSDGKVTFWAGDDTNWVAITSSNSVCDNSWHHVVVVRDNHAGYIWVDGTSRYSNTSVFKAIGSMAPASSVTTTLLRIGVGFNGSLYGYYTGSLAEVAVYSRALTQTEVTYHYAGTGDTLPTPIVEVDWANKADAEVYADAIRAAAPVAYWRFDDEATAARYGAAVLATNPVAFWRLGEKSGSVAVNATGNTEYDMAYYGSPTYNVSGGATDGDTAVTLNGSSSYVGGISGALLNLPTYSLSISYWYKGTATSGISLGKGSVSSYAYVAYIDASGYPYLYLYNYNASDWKTAKGTQVINDNTWRSVVWTWDGTTIRCYVNGTLGVGSTTGTGTLNAGSIAEFNIAHLNDGSAGLSGSYDDVALWNRTLSATEISNLYAEASTQPGAVVRNEVAPSDQGGFAGSPLPTLSLDYSPIKGIVPRSCATIASGGYFKTGTDAYTDVAIGTAAFSVEGWFHTEVTSSSSILFHKLDAAWLGGYLLYHVNTSGLSFARLDSAGNSDTITGPVLPYGWRHIVAVYTGSYLQLYVDGQSWATQVASSRSIPNTTAMFQVSGHGGAAYFTGKCSDIAIYNRALTATEIARHYDIGADPGYSDAIDDITSRVMEARRVSGRSADFSADAQGELTLTCKNTDRFFTPQRNLIENPSFEVDLRWWSTQPRAGGYLGESSPFRQYMWRMSEAGGPIKQRHGSMLSGNPYFRGLSYAQLCDAIPGDTTTGISFDGSTSWAQISDPIGALSNNYASVSMLVKVTARPAAGKYGHLAGFTAALGWRLTINENGILKFGLVSDAAYVTSSVALTNGVWYHVLAFRNYTTSSYAIWIDGVDRTSGSGNTAFLSGSSTTVTFGGLYDTAPDGWFNGTIKDVSIGASSLVPYFRTSDAVAFCAKVAAGGTVGDGCTITQASDAAPGAGSRCLSVSMPVNRKYAGVHTNVLGSTFRAGSRYTLSMYLKSASGGTAMTFGVGTDQIPVIASSNVTVTGSWTRYTLTWTMPSTYDSLVVFIRNNGASAAVLLVDAVQLTAGTSSPAYVEGPTKRQLAQGSPVRMRATFNGVTYPLFTGVIERIVPNDKATEPYVTIYARDPLFILARSTVRLGQRTRSLREIRRSALNQSLIPGADNLVSNGDFVSGTSGWSIYEYADIAPDTDSPPGFGGHSMRIDHNTHNTSSACRVEYRKISGLWPTGTVFTLSAWIKVTGPGLGSGQTRLILWGEKPSYAYGTFYVARVLTPAPDVWQRVSLQATTGGPTGALRLQIEASRGSSLWVDRVVLSEGKTIQDASPATSSPVPRANMADGRLSEIPCQYGCNIVADYENRVPGFDSDTGASMFGKVWPQWTDIVSPLGSAYPGWHNTPDGTGLCVRVDGSGLDGCSAETVQPGVSGHSVTAVSFSVHTVGQGAWCDLWGSFQKGVTYQFCADIKVPSLGSWRAAVFNADTGADVSYGTEVNTGSGWVTVTWSWTPTYHARRARMSVYFSTADITYPDWGSTVYLTRVRGIEYGSTITYNNPAPNDTAFFGRTALISTTTETRPDGGLTTVTTPCIKGNNPYRGAQLDMAMTFLAEQTYRLTVTMWVGAANSGKVRVYFGASGDETAGQLVTTGWNDYIFDWTPTADREVVRLRFVNEQTSTTLYPNQLLVANLRLTQERRNPAYVAPIASRSPGHTAQSTNVQARTNTLGLPYEEGEVLVPDYRIDGSDCLSVLGWVNAQSGSRHYVIPTLIAPYFFEYQVTTVDESRLKATAESVDDVSLMGLSDFVVGAEAMANSVIVGTGTTMIDISGATQPQDMGVAGTAGDEYSSLRHGVYMLERRLEVSALPEYAYTGGPAAYDRWTPLPFRLASHLAERYKESRARPTAKRVNQFPAILRRMPDDVYEITTDTLGLAGARFSVQSQTLSITAGGKIWELDEQLEEM